MVPLPPEAAHATVKRTRLGYESAAGAHSKARRIVDLLQTGTGASLEDMTTATGWQVHTVRAAMTGLRKRGYTIARNVEGNTSVWSIGTAA